MKHPLACLFALLPALVLASEIVVTAPAPEAAATRTPQTCAFPGLQLPANAVVYAAGGYSGKALDYQIDQSGNSAGMMDVTVHNPAQPVVLMLGAYDPTVWRLYRSSGTRVLAVLLTGYHRQAMVGLPAGTPTLISYYDNNGACGWHYVDADNLKPLNPLSRQLFGRAVSRVYLAQEGRISIGAPMPAGTVLLSENSQQPQPFRDRSAPLAGATGLAQALQRGQLRRAGPGDAQAWVKAVAGKQPPADVPPIAGSRAGRLKVPEFHDGYVVLRRFTYPAGLYGAHAVTFFIPAGVPTPSGNPGHSAVYDFNTLQCQGGLCDAQ